MSLGLKLDAVRYRAEAGGGETRYARPCLPVKPLDMMDAVGMRSVRHFEQRRCEVEVEQRNDVGCGGEEDGEGTVEVVEAETVELRRRRNGMLGNKYSGNGAGGVCDVMGMSGCCSTRSANCCLETMGRKEERRKQGQRRPGRP